ncbi:MAG: type I restriction endonuclease subunit M [Proteobacteria bacterium]|nr:type I restriction endonuclease subunit M [Pseudomonadota bacterium]
MVETQDLERHLWRAAELLRGSIDSGEYKHYIFGLFFFKRLCDLWDEELELEEKHRFKIPTKAHFSAILKRKKGIGAALTKALREIEKANTALDKVFFEIDFSNSERFSDALMKQLLEHWSKMRFRQRDLSSSAFGDAYEYLIKHFADDGGQKGGEFYTPRTVVQLLIQVLDPDPQMSVYDPTCGSGGMLLAAAAHMIAKGGEPEKLNIFGQEKNLNTWGICRTSMLLQGLNAEIQRGDTLSEPCFLRGKNKLRRFDCVIANPPFSMRNWGYSSWLKGDPYGRSELGVPPKSYGDMAFLMHMICSLKDTGRMGVVLPNGVLFRSGREAAIRKQIIQNDWIDTVVALGSNLFYGAAIPATILFLNKKKPKERKAEVLMINAELEQVERPQQSFLSADNIKKIMEVIDQRLSVPQFSRRVSLKEIEDHDYNLSMNRYVRTTPPEPMIDINSVYQQLRELQEKERQLISDLDLLMKEIGGDSL